MFDKLTSRTLLSRTRALLKKASSSVRSFRYTRGVACLKRAILLSHGGGGGKGGTKSTLVWHKKHHSIARQKLFPSFLLLFSLGLEGEKWRKSGWGIHATVQTAAQEEKRKERDLLFGKRFSSLFPRWKIREKKKRRRRRRSSSAFTDHKLELSLSPPPLSLSPPSLSSELSAFATTLCHYGVQHSPILQL